jgi:sugar phosphate isomerase/epimerase
VTFRYTDPFAIEAVADALRSSGIRVHSMHGPMVLGPPTEESSFGAAGLDGLIEAECAGIDAVMALGGRFLVTQDAAEREPLDRPHLSSPDALRALADYALAHGCVFCLENGAEDPDGFLRIARTVQSLAHPGLGMCLDVGHAQTWCLNDVPRAIRTAGTWLRSCHLHDNIGVSDAHLCIGDGILPWHAVLEALSDVGYRGPLLCESWSGGGRGKPIDVLTKSRMLLESLADRAWHPVARVSGCDIFDATEADRTRARAIMGGDAIPAEATGAAVVVADRFGDPVAWAEFVLCAEPACVFAASRRIAPADRQSVANAAIGAWLGADAVAPRVYAEGAAAAALASLGCEMASPGVYRTLRVARSS